MKKATTVWLITAASLVLLGALIFGGSLMALHFDFSKLSTTKYETNTYAVTEEFHSVYVFTDTADVTFLRSDDEKASVVCTESVKMKHTVSVEDGTLTVNRTDTRKWYEYISIFSKKERVTVYLPKSEYDSITVKGSTGNVRLSEELLLRNIDVAISTGDVICLSDTAELMKLKTTTGHIYISNVTAGSMELKVSTGDVELMSATVTGEVNVKVSTGDIEFSGIRCGSLISTGSTGEVELVDVIATGLFSIERSTGDVELTECDAGEIHIKTDTGDVSGSLLSDKIFFPKSDTGRIRVPKTTTGGTCAITTDTGNIRFVIILH